MRPSSVGQIIEEWLSAYMDEKIYIIEHKNCKNHQTTF